MTLITVSMTFLQLMFFVGASRKIARKNAAAAALTDLYGLSFT